MYERNVLNRPTGYYESYLTHNATLDRGSSFIYIVCVSMVLNHFELAARFKSRLLTFWASDERASSGTIYKEGDSGTVLNPE